jgi:linoleate 10R-lipoxygenase
VLEKSFDVNRCTKLSLSLLSSHFFETITPGVVGKILGLSNLQRGPGESGEFTRFTQNLRGAPEQVYVDARGGLTPFPTSLIVSYTEDQGAY